MKDNLSNNKNQLELSKSRLANAFSKLEFSIDQFINQQNLGDISGSQEAIADLKDKIVELTKQNGLLANDLTKKEQELESIKSLNQNIIEELDFSINSLSSIIKTEDGNN